MRKGRDGEKKIVVKWKIMMKIVATNVVASFGNLAAGLLIEFCE